MAYKLSPPWVTYYREIKALFGDDPEIVVVFHEEEKEIKLFVNDNGKAYAIRKLLPDVKEFGIAKIKITVIPCNVKKGDDYQKLFEKAFDGNPVLSYITPVEEVFSNPILYVVFEKEVVQFYNDNLGDINGNRTTLYENIARDVFGEMNSIYFCTDDEEDE